jgi:hypothetical protein
MQKIEKWRIKELAQVLNQISILLRKGQNAEWANVFSHFAQEADHILQKKELALDSLIRLIQNIVNCFDEGRTLRDLVLRHENSDKMAELNQEFSQRRNLLLEILTEMEARWSDTIN